MKQELIPTENLAFTLEQAEKVLDSTIGSYDALAGKAFTLFSLIVPIVSALFLFILVHLSAGDPLLWTAVVYAGFLTASAVYCWKVVTITRLAHCGRQPLSFTSPEVRKPLGVLYERQIMLCQTYIDENNRQLDSCSSWLRRGMRCFLYGTFVTGLVLLICRTV